MPYGYEIGARDAACGFPGRRGLSGRGSCGCPALTGSSRLRV
ncbi:hypothetical protein ACFPRL_09890 [Pseudoclavibacter helvolus]